MQVETDCLRIPRHKGVCAQKAKDCKTSGAGKTTRDIEELWQRRISDSQKSQAKFVTARSTTPLGFTGFRMLVKTSGLPQIVLFLVIACCVLCVRVCGPFPSTLRVIGWKTFSFKPGQPGYRSSMLSPVTGSSTAHRTDHKSPSVMG